MAPQAPPQVQG
jgi:hypothetical protein